MCQTLGFCLRSARAQTGWLLTAPGSSPRLQATNCRPPPVTAFTPYTPLLYLPATQTWICFLHLKVDIVHAGDGYTGYAGIHSYFLACYCTPLRCSRAARGRRRTPGAVLSYQTGANQFTIQLPITAVEGGGLSRIHYPVGRSKLGPIIYASMRTWLSHLPKLDFLRQQPNQFTT